MVEQDEAISDVTSKRKNFNFNVEDLQILTKIASRTGQNETVTVKRALRLLDLFIEETRNGNTIEVHSKKGRVKQIILL